jgi:hypothetical protein
VVPRLLRDYHLELVHPGRPLKESSTFFVVQEGLEVYISKKPIETTVAEKPAEAWKTA